MLLKTYPGKKMVKACHGGIRFPTTVTTYRRRDDVLVVTTPDGQQFVLPFEDTLYATQLLKNMNAKEKNEKPI